MRVLALWILMALSACSTEVAATNPFDPGTPATQQAEGRIVGRLYVEAPGDLGPEAYVLLAARAKARNYCMEWRK